MNHRAEDQCDHRGVQLYALMKSWDLGISYQEALASTDPQSVDMEWGEYVAMIRAGQHAAPGPKAPAIGAQMSEREFKQQFVVAYMAARSAEDPYPSLGWQAVCWDATEHANKTWAALRKLPSGFLGDTAP